MKKLISLVLILVTIPAFAIQELSTGTLCKTELINKENPKQTRVSMAIARASIALNEILNGPAAEIDENGEVLRRSNTILISATGSSKETQRVKLPIKAMGNSVTVTDYTVTICTSFVK